MIGMHAALLLVGSVGSIAIEHVRVLAADMPPREDVTVVIEGSQIAAIGKQPAPAGAERIDGRNRVLAPGWLAISAHAGLVTVDDTPDAADASADGVAMAPALRALDAFNPASPHLPRLREQGITHALLVPTGTVIWGQGSLVALDAVRDPRPDGALEIAAPAALFGSIGSIAGTSRSHAWMLWRAAIDDARRSMQKPAARAQEPAAAGALHPSQLQALASVLQARVPLVLWLDRAADIVTAVHWARREKLNLVVAGGAEAWTVAPLLARAQVPVVLRPSAQQVANLDSLQARPDSVARLHAAGVRVIIAAHGGAAHEDLRLRQEAGLAVRFGLPYAAALAAISSSPAAVFAPGQDLGRIARGAPANLVLWSGDPLELSSLAEKVWIRGQAQDQASRQTALVRRYLAVRP